MERELSRLALASQAVRLGSIAIERTGLALQEVRTAEAGGGWVGGGRA